MRIPTCDDCDIKPSLQEWVPRCHTHPGLERLGHSQVGDKGQSRVIKGAAPGEAEQKATGAEMPVTPWPLSPTPRGLVG